MAFDLSKAAFGKATVSKLDTSRKIPIDEIFANDDNFYSITGIEELAESIKMVGLLSPVNVVKTDAGYKLISGHRRLAAFKLLRGGDDADASSYDRIPAIVVSGLDDLTETMALITANSTARELTYADKCKQEDMLRKTLLAMRDAGRDIPKNLGQYIADQIGVSRNEVSRMHSINTNLAPEHRARLEAGELTAKDAYDLSRQSQETQKAAEKDSATSSKLLDPAQKRILNDFFDEKKHVLASAALRYSGGLKSDPVNGIRILLYGAGGKSFDWGYAGEKASVLFWGFGDGPDFKLSYRDLYNEFCQYAVLQLREPCDKSAVVEWNEGLATENGAYVCRMKFAPEAKEVVRVLYRKNSAWSLNASATSIIDIGIIIEGWIKLPDWGEENEEISKDHN